MKVNVFLVPGLFLCIGLASGGESDNSTGQKALKVEPVLSVDPKVTGILKGLGDGCSALLPPIKTAGDFNDVARSYNMQKSGPKRRDYCNKMVWAPYRKRALYCGGNHGAPHRLNDAWEYDLPSNTWVLLFAPDPNKDVNRAVVKEYRADLADGKVAKYKVLATKRGGPFDPCHTWWGLTYDPGMKAMLWMDTVCFLQGAACRKLGVSPQELAPGPNLWAFYPYEKMWRRVITGKPFPGATQGGAMEYVPDLKGSVWYGNGWRWSGMWKYDYKTNSWSDLKPNGISRPYGNKGFPGAELVTAYDSASKVLVAQRGKTTYHYELAANSWKVALSKPKESTEVPSAHDASSIFAYDSVGKVCVLLTGKQFWTYNLVDNKWTKVSPKGPDPLGRSTMGYYDPERNVFVVNAGSHTWVYRHRRAAE